MVLGFFGGMVSLRMIVFLLVSILVMRMDGWWYGLMSIVSIEFVSF